ncbi:MAG: hypothetical protein ACLQLG_05225 [Thermoguttaceae bacterium]
MNISSRASRLISVLSLWAAFVAVLAIAAAAAKEAQPDEERVKRLDRLIDAMASRNKEPKIVVTFLNCEVPMFADKYDWSEQARVSQALEAVVKDNSDEMWWRLQKYFHDGRYCATGDTEASAVEMTAQNFSVGAVCQYVATEKLATPYLRHLRADEGRIHPEFDPQNVFWGHEKQWAGKPLYLIQIAVCQRAIDQMKKAVGILPDHHEERGSPGRDFTAEEKSTFVREVTKEIDQLRRTKKAITAAPEEIGLPDEYGEFDAQDAKRAGELLKENKKERR